MQPSPYVARRRVATRPPKGSAAPSPKSEGNTAVVPNMRGVTLLSSALLIPPLGIWSLFVYVFTSYPGLSPFSRFQIFLDYFPLILRSEEAVSAVVLICSVTAIILGLKAFSRSSGLTRFICVINIGLGALITLLQAFTLL